MQDVARKCWDAQCWMLKRFPCNVLHLLWIAEWNMQWFFPLHSYGQVYHGLFFHLICQNALCWIQSCLEEIFGITIEWSTFCKCYYYLLYFFKNSFLFSSDYCRHWKKKGVMWKQHPFFKLTKKPSKHTHPTTTSLQQKYNKASKQTNETETTCPKQS